MQIHIRRVSSLQDVEYIIIGDTKDYDGCLICVCGPSKEHADEILERMKFYPTDNDLRLTDGHTNLRIKSVRKSKCWWNGYLD